MKFELKDIVPWGRNLEEYKGMFSLTEDELAGRILGVGDGPASFNAQLHSQQRHVISLDPIYGYLRHELTRRIEESSDQVIEQTRRNLSNFTWQHIKSVKELQVVRMAAMQTFLADFETGKKEGRYLPHAMPHPTTFADGEFDLGLSSHFLLLYERLGLDFHLQAITEMLRVCREVRIFPLLNLDAQKSVLLHGVLEAFRGCYRTEIVQVAYEFQKGGNEMLRIGR